MCTTSFFILCVSVSRKKALMQKSSKTSPPLLHSHCLSAWLDFLHIVHRPPPPSSLTALPCHYSWSCRLLILGHFANPIPLQKLRSDTKFSRDKTSFSHSPFVSMVDGRGWGGGDKEEIRRRMWWISMKELDYSATLLMNLLLPIQWWSWSHTKWVPQRDK